MSLSEKQEKALLEYADARARYDANRATAEDCERLQARARAYLASLEPKPEPKRGVDWLISATLERHAAAKVGPAPCGCFTCLELREALRLYRDERERDRVMAMAMRTIRGHAPSDVIDRQLGRWADELERRDG